MLLLIIGREKNLSKAEAESVFGEISTINDEVVTAKENSTADYDHLGGVIKVADIINNDAGDLVNNITDYINLKVEGGKINFGLSYYGFAKANNQLGINVKKRLKKLGRSVRYISAKDGKALNAAAVIYNKLTSKGCEIILAKNPGTGKIIMARTLHVQNINEYSKRDYDKPCRDRKVGMLPPKLSQMLINLSMAKSDALVVDPFCGSGGLLMEASLMGRDSAGSDTSSKMIDCTKKNLDWLVESYPSLKKPESLEILDARQFKAPERAYVITTEGYLGNNFITKPSAGQIRSQLKELESLYLDFLRQLQSQENKASAVVISAPFWVHDGKIIDLEIIDEISEMGYTIHEFKSVDSKSLRYKRENQYTGRRIFVLN